MWTKAYDRTGTQQCYYYEKGGKAKDIERQRVRRKTEHGKLLTRRNNHKRRSGHERMYTVKELAAWLKLFNRHCFYCLMRCKGTIDHIVALSVGGLDCLDNIVLCCKHCNSSKGARDVFKWWEG